MWGSGHGLKLGMDLRDLSLCDPVEVLVKKLKN